MTEPTTRESTVDTPGPLSVTTTRGTARWVHNEPLATWHLTDGTGRIHGAVTDEMLARTANATAWCLRRFGSAPPTRSTSWANPDADPAAEIRALSEYLRGLPPIQPPVRKPVPITHPDIREQAKTSSRPEIWCGYLTDNRAFRFVYDKGYATLGLGTTRLEAREDAAQSGHEWAIGAPTETRFASDTERDTVFKNMLAARTPAPPPPHTGRTPTTTERLPAPPGWGDQDILAIGFRDTRQPTITVSRTAPLIYSADILAPIQDASIPTYTYNTTVWNQIVTDASARQTAHRTTFTNSYTDGGHITYNPAPPAPPQHVPGTVNHCECTMCTGRRNLAAGIELTRRRHDDHIPDRYATGRWAG